MNKRELIYSQQSSDFIEGRAYSNPRFFSTPRGDVSKVLIVGDWPKIEAAYKALGIPVERLDTASTAVGVTAASPMALATAEDAAKVTIPDDWTDLPWTQPDERGLTLRSLASSVSAAPILNKKQATAAIKAELARRAAAGAAQPADGSLSPVLEGSGEGEVLPLADSAG